MHSALSLVDPVSIPQENLHDLVQSFGMLMTRGYFGKGGGLFFLTECLECEESLEFGQSIILNYQINNYVNC